MLCLLVSLESSRKSLNRGPTRSQITPLLDDRRTVGTTGLVSLHLVEQIGAY